MPKQLIKLTTILFLILFSVSLNAQIDSAKADHGININFFNGYAISYKWNTSQSLNYRIYLGLTSSWLSTSLDYNAYNSIFLNNTHTEKADETKKFLKTNISFQIIKTLFSNTTLRSYIGIGPNLEYEYNFSESIIEHDSRNIKLESSDYIFRAGVLSLLGVEGYLTSHITLFAESHISISKIWLNNRDIREHDDSRSNSQVNKNGWEANLQLVKVGLGIYF